ncbi:hypothetical protein GCM10027093_09260 [Paraburkholderia jirisanensis]
MSKRPDDPIDDENPEWTAEDFARARPASEVLPEIVGADVAEQLMRPAARSKQDPDS